MIKHGCCLLESRDLGKNATKGKGPSCHILIAGDESSHVASLVTSPFISWFGLYVPVSPLPTWHCFLFTACSFDEGHQIQINLKRWGVRLRHQKLLCKQSYHERGGGSSIKMLTKWAEGPEFRSPGPTQMPGRCGSSPVIPASARQRQGVLRVCWLGRLAVLARSGSDKSPSLREQSEEW